MFQLKKTSAGSRGSIVKGFKGTRVSSLQLMMALLIALAVLSLVTATLNRSSAANSRSEVTPPIAIGTKGLPAPPQEKVRTERVTAFPHGFEPDEITRSEGQFMLCVDNRAGSEPLSLTLTSGTLGPVYAAGIQKGSSGTNQLLNLPPGQYTLTEASKPGWVCTITINPN